MEENLLPTELLNKASISTGGEHAWKRQDIPNVIAAAKAVGLANLGGQVQYQGSFGTMESYWLDFGSSEKELLESWQHYVKRSADETLDGFTLLCDKTDFDKDLTEKWSHVSEVKKRNITASEHLWFILYFAEEEG